MGMEVMTIQSHDNSMVGTIGTVRVTASDVILMVIPIPIFDPILDDQNREKCRITESMHESPPKEILH